MDTPHRSCDATEMTSSSSRARWIPASAVIALVAGGACGGNSAATTGTSNRVPKTCADFGATCGSAPDGCTGVVSCGQVWRRPDLRRRRQEPLRHRRVHADNLRRYRRRMWLRLRRLQQGARLRRLHAAAGVRSQRTRETCGVPHKGGTGGVGATGSGGSGGVGATGSRRRRRNGQRRQWRRRRNGGSGGNGGVGATGSGGNGGVGATGSGGSGGVSGSGGTSSSTCGNLNQKPCKGDGCNAPYAKCGPYCTARSSCCTSLTSCKGTQHCGGGHGEWQCTWMPPPACRGSRPARQTRPRLECAGSTVLPASAEASAKCRAPATSASLASRSAAAPVPHATGAAPRARSVPAGSTAAGTASGNVRTTRTRARCRSRDVRRWPRPRVCAGSTAPPASAAASTKDRARARRVKRTVRPLRQLKCVPKADCCKSRASCPTGQSCGGHGEWQCTGDPNLCDSKYTACTTGPQSAGRCWISCS